MLSLATMKQSPFNFAANLTDLTYHMLNAMQEAKNDPNDCNQLRLMEDKHYVLILSDIVLGE